MGLFSLNSMVPTAFGRPGTLTPRPKRWWLHPAAAPQPRGREPCAAYALCSLSFYLGVGGGAPVVG